MGGSEVDQMMQSTHEAFWLQAADELAANVHFCPGFITATMGGVPMGATLKGSDKV